MPPTNYTGGSTKKIHNKKGCLQGGHQGQRECKVQTF